MLDLGTETAHTLSLWQSSACVPAHFWSQTRHWIDKYTLLDKRRPRSK